MMLWEMKIMIKVVSSQITIGDAAIVCNKTIDFSKFLEKYSELTKKMIEETIVQSGMKVDEAKASFSGAVSLQKTDNVNVCKLLAEARCDLKISKFIKRLVHLVVKAQSKKVKQTRK